LETQAVKNFLKRQYFQQSFQLSHSLSPPSSACSRVEKTVEVAPKSVPDIASICPQENSPSELWPALPRKLVIQPAVASSVSSVGSHVEVGTIQEMSSFPGDALTSTVREVDSREDCMPTRNVGELGKEAIPEKKQPEMLQFFQSRDGQQVYLHPLNVKCLIEEFGIDSLPLTLTGRVITLSEHSLTAKDKADKSQPSYAFLGHLPTSSIYYIAFLNLDSILSEATKKKMAPEIEAYHEQLRQREAVRRREERRAHQRAIQLEKQLAEEASYTFHCDPNELSHLFDLIPESIETGFPDTLHSVPFPSTASAKLPIQTLAGAPTAPGTNWSSLVKEKVELWEPLPSRAAINNTNQCPSLTRSLSDSTHTTTSTRTAWGTQIRTTSSPLPVSTPTHAASNLTISDSFPALSGKIAGGSKKSKRGTVLFTLG